MRRVITVLVVACIGLAGSVPSAAAAKPKPRPSDGCDAREAVAGGDTKVDTTSGGVPRYYFQNIPPAYDGETPLPLVIDLHGYSEGAQIHKMMSQLGPYGDEHGFITVTPQGSGSVPRWDTRAESPDMQFIGDLLEELEGGLCIDLRRVYAAGLSNGAFMASAVACVYNDRFAAVAPVAGVRAADQCAFDRPVSLIAFHGTADTLVPYGGGLGESVANLPAPDGSGRRLGVTITTRPGAKPVTVPQHAATWAKRNGCGKNRVDKKIGTDVVLTSYKCPKGVATQLYTVEGGGHAWPGSDFSKRIERVVGFTTFTVDATELMWEFFEAHPMRKR